MPIINLTNVTVRLAGDDDEVYATFDPDDRSVEVKASGDEKEMDGVPIEITRVTGFEGLPDEEEGTFYIVPQPVAYVSNRTDFVTPDTGPSAIRDDEGKVYACRRLFCVVSDSEA